MDIGTVSARYARALLMYAIEQHEEDRVYRDMSNMLYAFVHVSSLRHILGNPLLKNEAKEQLLESTVGADISDCTKNFIHLVVAKRRTEMASFMANSFLVQYRKYKKITTGCLTTAYDMDEAEVARLQQLVEQRSRDHVVFNVVKDESLKGGFILEYDTYRLDASLKEQLHRIKKELLK